MNYPEFTILKRKRGLYNIVQYLCTRICDLKCTFLSKYIASQMKEKIDIY